MKRLQTIKGKIQYRIRRSAENVFILNDFIDIADKDQVGRALRKLIKEDQILKIGQGIYVKARYSEIFKKIMPIRTLPELAKEAFEKLGIDTAPTSWEQLYRDRKSTQVPTGSVIGVTKRVSRNISYDGWKLSFEHVS